LYAGEEGNTVKSRYLLFQKAEAALIEEKSSKLFGLTRLLDLHLEGDYDGVLLSTAGPQAIHAPASDRIRILNERLAPFTDQLAAAFPGVGVGYYSRDLRAILTYGPSRDFGSKVGTDLGLDHLGWQAMATGKETVAVGSMVRGEIMNCMRPLIRRGRAIGFVWANEALEDIYAQIQVGAGKLFFSPEIEPLLGLTGILLFASKVLLLGKSPSYSGSSVADSRPAGSHMVHRLEQLKCYLELFLNTLSLAVILSDADGHIAFVSRGIQDILGETPASFVSRDIRSVLQCMGIDPHTTLDEFADGSLNRFVNVAIKTHEGERPITMVCTRAEWPMAGPAESDDHSRAGDGHSDGNQFGHIVILEDLKEAQANEERLERAERLAAVGELAAAVAHEIRNPLAVLKGAVSLVPRRLDDREFLEQFSQVATAEMDRINGTVESLLRFSRYSQPHMVSTDIRRIAEKARNLISEYGREMGVAIEFTCPADVPALCGDSDHLTQAILNLLLNGIQAMPAGGTLRVEVKWKLGARYVQIAVADTGMGIAPELRDHVFEMFFTTKESGTGLGLPLVQRIVYNHHGFVEFESETGKGTTFIVRLPVIAQSCPELR
jgi:two-component system sensor histidine kinase AtoS